MRFIVIILALVLALYGAISVFTPEEGKNKNLRAKVVATAVQPPESTPAPGGSSAPAERATPGLFAEDVDEFVPFAGYDSAPEPTPFVPIVSGTLASAANANSRALSQTVGELAILEGLRQLAETQPSPVPTVEVDLLAGASSSSGDERAKNSPSGLLSGAVSSGTQEIGDEDDEDADDEITQNTPAPDGERSRVSGQARGYSALYLMHPSARATVERQMETLLKSELADIFLGVLADGTFSWDAGYFSFVLRRLAQGDRSLTLEVYLTNGSAMRQFKNTAVDAPFAQIEPREFRSLIRFDGSLRSEFQRLVRRVIPLLDLNLRLNSRNKNYVVVMLEDNLDRDSYQAMRGLAQELIGTRATFLRNPCPGCYEGNDIESLGDGLELHRLQDFARLSVRDGYSLDGIGYSYPEDAADERPTLSEVIDLARIAYERNLRFFALWRHEWQGVRSGTSLLHPDERSYQVPTEEQALHDIEVLRHGLGSG